MKIRRALADDVGALASVHAQAFDQAWPPKAFAELLSSPGVVALAAINEDLVGVILMRAIAGEAEVLTLAVAPAYRRQGVAGALLTAGLSLAMQAGAQAVFLEVAADNPAAIALYRAAGFTDAGRRANYYPRRGAPAVDALLLRRTLNSPIP